MISQAGAPVVRFVPSSPENREKEVPVAPPQTPSGQNSSLFIPVSAIRLTSVLTFFDALYSPFIF